MTAKIIGKNLGLIKYQEALELQRKLHQDLISGNEKQYLLFCEHPPVITHGRAANITKNILAAREKLSENGVAIFEVERGGDVTYHGPGQLVVYPILDLHLYQRDVNWYLRSLEEIIILSLSDFGVCASSLSGKTGVWLNKQKKIASIGVRLSKWRTMHGISINIFHRALTGFANIIGCGLDGVEMVALEDFFKRGELTYQNFITTFSQHFTKKFDVVDFEV